MKLTVNTAAPYDVLIENGAVSNIGEILKKSELLPEKILILSESNVFPIFGEVATGSLRDAGAKVLSHIFKAGEKNKTLDTVNEIYKTLSENGFTRSDLILNLGGGVTGDVGGFAAATFLRGIRFVQVPTSLLAQVDASVGGKTGVDTPYGKNLVGAFHQPRMVVIDPETLKTLPNFYFSDGMGEVIKYGCIDDAELFESLMTKDTENSLEDVIFRCVDSKRRFVEEDVKDTGRRMILNFGHTFGHAVEKLSGFGNISHGEAVGIGMVLAARFGEKAGLTEAGTSERIKLLLEKYHLRTEAEFSVDELIEATALDKKSDGGSLNFILLKKIGEAFIYKTTRAEISGVLNER